MKRSKRLAFFALFVATLFVVLVAALAQVRHWQVATILLPIGILAQLCCLASLVTMIVFRRKAH